MKPFTSCSVIRRKLVRMGTFDMIEGNELSLARGATEEWRTEPCGTPLFGATERETGVCRSCASGWTHPHNYRVEEGA